MFSVWARGSVWTQTMVRTAMRWSSSSAPPPPPPTSPPTPTTSIDSIPQTAAGDASRDPVSAGGGASPGGAVPERKRFYRSVTVSAAPATAPAPGFVIKLDDRQLRTPARSLLVLPTKALAVGVAGEWDSQRPTIKPHLMPLTALSNTATDPHRQRDRNQRVEDLLRFLATDTVCCRTPDPAAFQEMQSTHWDPLVHWFTKRFGVELNVSEDLFGGVHPEATTDRMRDVLKNMNEWTFTGLETATLTAKSMVIAAALGGGYIDANQATICAHLEEEFQTERWGKVEWGHGMRHADTRMTLAAAGLFMRLATENARLL
ncbi:hypothetical protein CAOG_00582 [Capsaspora owczarzaki ATCC 30864]|uniref:ATP synthase mitochondrial F1 complex assembly factor 2 n=1 Tax=Capsaspora owczarzaki (strain ATCC 30864) TaxID=595528 RepID=A0A0D2WIS5_CAPO3|nr:hypothetical protein CAOG_00582 [Capsaspora owczarzaki ATCC 30864]KJE89023.1 hypothetical protein CAOG_000582 [Capsaspora owczarzaki ATCC 30864]|eukprot:XP_004365453.2 hypothetical protein CAOG_00582 [Capsaspora owczarzaki ATCC 30864]